MSNYQKKKYQNLSKSLHDCVSKVHEIEMPQSSVRLSDFGSYLPEQEVYVQYSLSNKATLFDKKLWPY